MAEFADATIVKTGYNSYGVQYGDDTQTHAEFEQVAVMNEQKSLAAGCPQYDNVDFIKIMFPGDKTKIIHRPANAEYKARFPKQWEAYKNGTTQATSGFPLEQWPILTKGEALDLKGRGIHTVEMLANLPDSNCSFFGAMTYREKARATLAKAQDGSVVLAVKAENAILKADLEMLKEQIREMATRGFKEPEELETAPRQKRAYNRKEKE